MYGITGITCGNNADGRFLRSKGELFYYRIFKQMYPQDELIPLVGRSRSV